MTVPWVGDPVWLEDVLREWIPANKLRALPAWKEYGHGDYGSLWGVMIHHTGNARETAESIQRGRPDLQGPLSNLHIAPDGTVTVVAAGVCWHAGAGSYPGIPTNNANYHLIGIECAWPANTLISKDTEWLEKWPDPQIISMRDTVAGILNRLGFSSSRVIAHKEWAGASQGKWDPGNLDMNWFRAEVAKAQRGEFKTPAPQPIPQPQPQPIPQPVPQPKPSQKRWPTDASDRELLEDIWRRLAIRDYYA